VLTAPNQEWALDFASDLTDPGQRFRVLEVIDGLTRQSHVLETATSFPSRRVTRELERAIAAHGKPQAIRCDNGPEFTSRHFLAWAIEWKIDIVHIQPGKPTQNGGMESFNGKLRDECLNVNWFWNLFDARRATRALSRDGREQAYAREIAAEANRLLEARGERARLSPEKVGHTLKKLGLRTRAISQSGHGLTFDKATLARIYELAAMYMVDVMEDTPAEAKNLHDSQTTENK
jgi:putative transposase